MNKPIVDCDDIKIWRVLDSETGGCIPRDTFPAVNESSIVNNRDWLYPSYIDADNNFIMAMQSFIIKQKNTVILVDGGIGNDKARYTPWANGRRTNYLENLEETGFTEKDINIVLSTHLHMDHVGWFTRLHESNWIPTFPNARYYVNKEEYDYWKHAIDSDNIDTRIALLDSVEPMIKFQQAEFISSDFRFDENTYFEPLPGHSPGHTAIHIKSGGHHIIIAGDVFHHPIQVNEPSLTADYYDVDIGQSHETRLKFIEKYANSGTIIIGLHFASNPAGCIEEHNGKTLFKPVVM